MLPICPARCRSNPGRRRRARRVGVLIAAASLAASAPASAQQADAAQSSQSITRLGIQPGEPLVPSATPSVPFGIHPAESSELVLDFHGYLLLPMEVGVESRVNPQPGQSDTVLHVPPVIPQYIRGFEYTGAIPSPWGQLNFTYGNSIVSATVVMATGTFSTALSYYDTTNQLGVYDAYLTADLTKPIGIPFEVNVGALIGRYGAMGAYDAGRYGTPLIARTNMVGETITAAYPVGKLQFVLEQGFGGQLANPPVGLVPAGWNGFADPNVGGSLLNQVHLGLSYAKRLQLGLHYITGWTQTDQVPSGNIPDGRITVLGADAHLSGQYGHLFLGVAHTQATNAESVGGVVEILNARGGPELIAGYLGPNSNGNGSLTTYGAQYDVSLSRLIFGPLYTGESPDILVSAFGVGTQVSSHDPQFDGVTKLKGGVEVTYDFLSWMGVSERFDHVRLNASDSTQAFSILSSRLLFHTGWKARNEIALQYSYFSDGAHVYARTGYPPVIDPSYSPDLHVLSLIGNIWW
ncbi:MAG TPA: hypothetical protein VE987_21595 [Polyangiaceae bacterium]|nr:hypothetical protein [Polyangiaceae bacterium]